MRGSIMGATLALLISTGPGTPAFSADLTISVDGVRSDAGWVFVAVYNRADAFPSFGRALATQRVRARRGAVSATVADIAAARCAVAAFHDEDGDGALDENMLGMPTEGFGFSNGAQAFLGPPSFAAAAVPVCGGGQTLPVALTYLWSEK